MDYITYLIKASKKLLEKVKSLKQELREIQEAQDAEDTYYSKYKAVSTENVNLKERVAKLELELTTANYELEKRNNTILQLSTKQH